jgi:hypothetical protein
MGVALQAASVGAGIALIVTRRENVRSRRSIAAVGFRQIASITCYRLGGWVVITGCGAPKVSRAGTPFALPVTTS